jgi:hypothetical protein
MAIVKTKVFVYLPGVIDAKIEFSEADIYQDINSIVGIFPPTIIYNPALRLSTGELRRNGVLIKLLVRTETKRSHTIYCSVEKLSTALPSLIGKKVPEQSGTSVEYKKITKVSIPRRRTRI